MPEKKCLLYSVTLFSLILCYHSHSPIKHRSCLLIYVTTLRKINNKCVITNSWLNITRMSDQSQYQYHEAPQPQVPVTLHVRPKRKAGSLLSPGTGRAAQGGRGGASHLWHHEMLSLCHRVSLYQTVSLPKRSPKFCCSIRQWPQATLYFASAQT